MTNPTLNLDHDMARALHRVVRAMHDGECPKCHKVHMSDVMHVIDRGPGMDVAWSGLRCPNCKFQISDEEAAEVFRIFGPFMEQNLDLFTEWRHSRNKEISLDAEKATRIIINLTKDLETVTKRLQDHPTKFRVAIRDEATLKDLEDAIKELRELTLTIITR